MVVYTRFFFKDGHILRYFFVNCRFAKTELNGGFPHFSYPRGAHDESDGGSLRNPFSSSPSFPIGHNNGDGVLTSVWIRSALCNAFFSSKLHVESPRVLPSAFSSSFTAVAMSLSLPYQFLWRSSGAVSLL